MDKLIIRVDGGEQIGMGHLVRCLAISEMIKDKFKIEFACLSIPEITLNEINDLNHKVSIYKTENEFISSIEKNELVLIDGYIFDEEYQRLIKGTNAILICIDDLNDKEFYCDLIINHSIGSKTRNYKIQKYTRLAIGPEYALLRKPFLEQAKMKRVIKKIDSILICFGGADEFNLTELSLKAAIQFKEFKKIVVITGVAYKHINSLNKTINSDNRIIHRSNLSAFEMRDEMIASDLAIAPGSGILYELMACKSIIITGHFVENQRIFIKNISKFNNIINITTFNEQTIKKGISDSFKLKHSNETFIDGNSDKRIMELLFGLKKKHFIVTGSSKGIGAEIVKELLTKENCFVVGVSRSKLPEIDDPDRYNQINIDLSKNVDVKFYKYLNNLLRYSHDITFINNAASIDPIKEISLINKKEVEQSVNLNIISPLNLCIFIMSQFKYSKITIINISSGASNKSIPHWSLYSSAKAYTNRFFEILQKENEKNPIFRFLNIDPGMVDTGMQKSIRDSSSPDKLLFQKAKQENKLLTPNQAALSILKKL